MTDLKWTNPNSWHMKCETKCKLQYFEQWFNLECNIYIINKQKNIHSRDSHKRFLEKIK